MTKLYPCSKLEQFKVGEKREGGRKRGGKKVRRKGGSGEEQREAVGGYEDEFWTTSWLSTYSPISTPKKQLSLYSSIHF